MVHVLLRDEPLLVEGQPAVIRAVLFDKDGTMSKSEPKLLAQASSRLRHCLALVGGSDQQDQLEKLLLRVYGLHKESQEEGFEHHSLDPSGITAVAARDHNLISTAVALTLVGHDWPEALQLAQHAFDLADRDQPPELLTAGVTEGLLDFLRALKSMAVKCAVISNDNVSGIQRFLNHHGLSSQMAAIWSADHQPRKPDPQAIHQLCASLGIPPGHCALIGDANSDLGMARSAGLPVMLGYRGGWQRPVHLEACYPVFDHWKELSVVPDQGVSMETRSAEV